MTASDVDGLSSHPLQAANNERDIKDTTIVEENEVDPIKERQNHPDNDKNSSIVISESSNASQDEKQLIKNNIHRINNSNANNVHRLPPRTSVMEPYTYNHKSDSTTTEAIVKATTTKTIQAFEIESDSHDDEDEPLVLTTIAITNSNSNDEDDDNPLKIQQSASLDEEEAEQQGLLPRQNSNINDVDNDNKSLPSVNVVPTRHRLRCLGQTERVGNLHIFLPKFYYKTGWGIYGPHWFGPPCVLAIIWLASWHFVRLGLKHVGLLTAIICLCFAVITSFNLLNVAYRDPGVCRNPNIPPEANARQYRWCDLCQVYQPPNGAHCADCNVCVAGYDHHCAWMGICVGRNNIKQFVRFNLSWLIYLLYAVIWVSFIGRLTSNKKQ